MKTARLYDLKHLCHAGEVPLSKLTPGHILAEVVGVEGQVWVRHDDLEDLRRHQEPPALPHPPLDEASRQRVQWFAGVLAEFEPLTPGQWEERLRREIDLGRELTRWGHIAAAYSHFTGGKTMPALARRDYYGLCVACFVNGPDAALATMPPLAHLSRARARRVVDHLRRSHRWQ